MPPPNAPPASTAGPPWWLVVLAIAAIAGGIYLWQRETPRPVPPPTTAAAPESAAPVEAAAAPAQPAEAAPPAPVADGPKNPLPGALPDASTMPPPERSDAPILEALLQLARRDALAQVLNMQDFARRFVVTVDHLPRELIPAQLSAVKRVPGQLAVASTDDSITLQPANFARYDAFVGLVESLDPKTMAAIYLRFYPLLQQEYRAMGFPQAHLHDRVIEAIDDMLTAPEVSGPIRLVQPKVNYRFVDPLLEKLSAGRKIMIRIGPEHAARMKKALRALRAELVR
ncbi:MAG: DUF3014 domain-containing protein [Burkholderiales bacterium]|nr:DUF3014 domain-containing protein [Burkholderiaceae bacterium]MCZ2414830.1 DUF3014 domain-containing protein [Burkholderiales bacterium]MDL1905986.1 DUF3014 domain-containing protein [Betaproteobacteria bacterium PRO1]MEB2335534.1 DUF3014 domain-containing protein [Burkholderiales bacterium]